MRTLQPGDTVEWRIQGLHHHDDRHLMAIVQKVLPDDKVNINVRPLHDSDPTEVTVPRTALRFIPPTREEQ